MKLIVWCIVAVTRGQPDYWLLDRSRFALDWCSMYLITTTCFFRVCFWCCKVNFVLNHHWEVWESNAVCLLACSVQHRWLSSFCCNKGTWSNRPQVLLVSPKFNCRQYFARPVSCFDIGLDRCSVVWTRAAETSTAVGAQKMHNINLSTAVSFWHVVMCYCSQRAVVVALCCNFLVFALKIGVWIVTSSHVMLAESIHSLADLANQVQASIRPNF